MATISSNVHDEATNYPEPKQGDWIARDFRFHSGEVFSELKLHYRTIGNPSGEPILVLHGTSGSGASMLNETFAVLLLFEEVLFLFNDSSIPTKEDPS